MADNANAMDAHSTRHQKTANGGFDFSNQVLPGVDFALPQQPYTARLAGWEQAARARQQIAFNDFLQTTAAQQFALRRARENDLSAALIDDVQAARQVRLSPLDPLLPSDPVQLEMTNLRLQLLENARLTPAQKRRARTRLAILEARWRQKLQSGQEANRNEFLEQRDLAPLQARNEGEARIVVALDQMRAQDLARISATQAGARQRLEADFDSQQQSLGIKAPAVSRRNWGDGVDASRKTDGSARDNLYKTFALAPPSNAHPGAVRTTLRALNFPTRLPPFENMTNATQARASDSDRSDIKAQIRALRKRALLESAQWQRLATRPTKSR